MKRIKSSVVLWGIIFATNKTQNRRGHVKIPKSPHNTKNRVFIRSSPFCRRECWATRRRWRRRRRPGRAATSVAACCCPALLSPSSRPSVRWGVRIAGRWAGGRRPQGPSLRTRALAGENRQPKHGGRFQPLASAILRSLGGCWTCWRTMLAALAAARRKSCPHPWHAPRARSTRRKFKRVENSENSQTGSASRARAPSTGDRAEVGVIRLPGDVIPLTHNNLKCRQRGDKENTAGCMSHRFFSESSILPASYSIPCVCCFDCALLARVPLNRYYDFSAGVAMVFH